MKPYPCIESTIEFKVNSINYRLWIDEKDLDYPTSLHTGIAEELEKAGPLTFEDKIKLIISKIPSVSAIHVYTEVEIIGKTFKLGKVVYTVPFSEDVHG